MEQATLKHANMLILTGLTQTPTANPDTMLGELCMTVGKSPVDPSQYDYLYITEPTLHIFRYSCSCDSQSGGVRFDTLLPFWCSIRSV